jgi:hypothetical protein
MTQTTTRTHTRTVTRTALIRLQLEVAARRLATHPDKLIERAIRPGLAEGFLGRLDFCAVDPSGVCHAMLSLGVDWNEHRGLVAASAEVRVPPGWVDRVAPEVHVAVELFQEVVEQFRATVEVFLVPAPGADRAKLAHRFGRGPCRRPRWSVKPSRAPLSVRELPELRVEFLTDEPSD